MKKFALLAAAALYAAPASATIVVPGTPAPGVPATATVGESGTVLATTIQSGTALTFSATLYSAVYQEATGTLDFLYQVARTGAGSAPTGNDQAINFLTASAFDGFLVDAFQDNAGAFGIFQLATNGADTSLISRSLTGDVLTVSFGLNNLAGTDVSPVYIFRTNATNFTQGTYGILDGSSLQGLAFAPTAVPEPATWMTLLAGFGVLGMALRFRRRNTAFA
jgi:hypothetical protein